MPPIIPESPTHGKAAQLMIRILPLFLLLIFFSSSAYADEEHARARLISAYDGAGSFAALEMGLELSLDDQWYTYWRMPGDVGLAPVIDWSKSENVQNVEISWPAPKRFTAFDMHSFGYDGTVVLPFKVMPVKTGEAVNLTVKLDIVVCHEICIPQTVMLEKNVPKGPAVKTPERTILTRAVSSLPSAKNTKELGIDTAVLGKDGITVIAYSKSGWGPSTDMFIDSKDTVLTSVPEVIEQSEGGKSVIRIKSPEGVDLASVLLGKKVVIVLHNGENSLEREVSF